MLNSSSGWNANGPTSNAPQSRVRHLGTSAINNTPIQTRRTICPPREINTFSEGSPSRISGGWTSPRAPDSPNYSPSSPNYSPSSGSGSPSVTGRGRRLRVAASTSLRPKLELTSEVSLPLTPVVSRRQIQLSVQPKNESSGVNTLAQFKPTSRALGSNFRESQGYRPEVSFPVARPSPKAIRDTAHRVGEQSGRSPRLVKGRSSQTRAANLAASRLAKPANKGDFPSVLNGVGLQRQQQ
jgi:hypothetical protein